MATEDNSENSINLENLLSPFTYVAETPLLKTTPEVPGGYYLSGFISQDCTWGCSYNHSVIKCFPVERYFDDNRAGSGGRTHNPSIAISCASYTFPGGRITCVTELAIHNQRTSSGTRKLLLGISYTQQDNNNKDLRGAVVLFDPLRCVPMKWIEIPDPVSSITVLSHFEEGGSTRPFFNETMMAMVGVAAVGLRGGSVIIVDLGLDDPRLLANTVDVKNIADLTYRLLYVNPHEYVIATKRHKAVAKQRLIALRFANEPEEGDVDPDAFYYCRPNGESYFMLPKNAVAVTCIEYVPFIGSLLVGFTCGTFQIWRVDNMELQFSSEPVKNLARCIPVFGFSFQQPIDDPKNYCYVWVVLGNNSNECGNSNMELYSLYYERKTYIENFGFTYNGFRLCSKRLQFPLQDDFLPTDGEREDSSMRNNTRPLRIWTQPDTELMFCAWEVIRGGIYYVGAFDLNQWYSNHTKDYIIYNPITGLCPYWVALPIDIPHHSNIVLDLRIIPKSLMRWENPHSKLDVHLYPASVSFRAVCLTNNGISAFEHFGVQEKLIRFVMKDGPAHMIQPANVKNSFMKYGLEPVFPLGYDDHLSDTDRDRFFLFSVLLESRRSAAILLLANSWLDGSYANVGCTIDLIIDWITSYMTAIRSVADSQWENLFSFSNDTLPPGTVHFINFSNFAWTSLHMMLITFMHPAEIYTARGLELEDIEFGLGKLVQYSAALLMMYKSKLLPHKDGNFIRLLTEYYKRRRANAKSLLEASVSIDNQYKKSHPLMIDHFMDALLPEETIREEWHTPEGQPLYPPQHVGYLLNMFMWPDADPKAVSRVFMYFLLDLNAKDKYEEWLHCNNVPIPYRSDVEQRVRGDFKAVMCSGADEYSEVSSLWMLDHEDCGDAMVHLKEKNRLFETDGLPWCAAAVALTAASYTYENQIAELLIRSCPVNLARLLFCLMTASGTKYSSLAELMVNSSLNTDDELLQQFFEISKARHRLGEFIRTKSKELTERMRRALLGFLKETNSIEHVTLLLMFYVYTEDYSKLEEEFMQVQNTLRHRNLSDSDRRKWKFQENYITHLLSVKRVNNVNQFLRLQTSQITRQVNSTVSIKANPASQMEPTTPERSQIRIKVSKLPPQLRKLSETFSQDPLSPLRRYAGRIQNAVTADTTVFDQEELEKDVRPTAQRFSRQSFSRRSSLALVSHKPRFSLGNRTLFENTVLNETISEEGERLNQTTRTNIDLISLLKAPTIDHRLENSQRISRNVSISCTQNETVGTEDESLLQPVAVHSIMKEKDSSKPKRMVELRFDNVSTSEDENNETIYEDANDLNGETSGIQVLGADSGDADALCADTSLEEDMDLPPKSLCENVICDEASHITATDDPAPLHLPTAAPPVASSIYESSFFKVNNPDDDDDDDVILGASNMDETREELNISVGEDMECTSVEKPVESDNIFIKPTQPINSSSHTNTVTYRKIEEENEDTIPVTEGEVEEKPDVPQQKKARLSKPTTTPKEVTGESETTPQDVVNSRSTRSSETVIRDVIGETQEDLLTKHTQRVTRTSRSRTPTRTEITEVEHISTSRVKRTSRSRTPTREQTETRDEEITPVSRVTRSSRSRTPTRELTETRDEEVTPVNRVTRRSSRSRTPTREHVEPQDVDETSARRITRSRTPTREAVETTDELQVKRIRTSGRTSRSTTPTRDANEDVTEESQGLPLRRKRRISKSTTPTREMSVTRDNEGQELSESLDDDDTSKPVRRSARTSKSRAREMLYEDEIDEQLESKAANVRRSTRSRTPTRDVAAEQPDVTISKIPKRRQSVSRSVTPTRDVQTESIIEEPETSRRSTRISRSRDSVGRELQGIPEESQEELETKSLRRSTRVSKTPTREFFEESGIVEGGDDSEVKTPRKRKSGRSSQPKSIQSSPADSDITIAEDNDDDESAEDNTQETEQPEKSRRNKKPREKPKAPKRRLKYFDHHQNLSTLVEQDSSTEVTVSDPSILEATILPVPIPVPAVTQKPKRRIKGIRARVEEPEPEVEPIQTKPSKRRKATNEDVLDEEDSDQLSTRSGRSTSSSKRSASSSKSKGSRRKGRSSSQPTA